MVTRFVSRVFAVSCNELPNCFVIGNKGFVTHMHVFSSSETRRCASFDSSFVVLRNLVSQMTLLVLLKILLHLWTGLSCKWVSHCCCCCWCSRVLELVMVMVKIPSGKVLPLNLRLRSLCFLYIPKHFFFFFSQPSSASRNIVLTRLHHDRAAPCGWQQGIISYPGTWD